MYAIRSYYGLPAARLDASGRGDLQQLGKLALALDTLGGKATLDGRLGWQQGLDWKARLMLANIDPGQHWPAAKGLINGKLETHGKLQQGWQASVDTLDIKGRITSYNVCYTKLLRPDRFVPAVRKNGCQGHCSVPGEECAPRYRPSYNFV